MLRTQKTQANKINIMLTDGTVIVSFIYINGIIVPSIDNILIAFFPRGGQLMLTQNHMLKSLIIKSITGSFNMKDCFASS